MNIKSILRSIRFLALLIGNMMMAGCSNSDKPAYLEPHLITTEATHITRTEATLNGSATIEGETEMPKLLFRYGTSESMNLNTSEVHAQGADVSLVLTGLKAGTTYYYMLLYAAGQQRANNHNQQHDEFHHPAQYKSETIVGYTLESRTDERIRKLRNNR